MNTVERARGRWREILPLLGIDPKYLVNRHGPCPLCGGKDRFRFDDIDGAGTYFCNQCGAGSGVIMLRKKHGWNHREACDRIDEIIGSTKPVAPKATARDDPDRRRAGIERVIAQSQDPEVVSDYLKGRGLTVAPTVLLGHTSLEFYENNRMTGRYPAVIAPITGPDGILQSVQRIYVGAPKEQRKKAMKPVGTITGATVRLFGVKDEMGVAEGVETAIAARELFHVPTWAALSTGGMESFRPPAGIQRLHIYSDHDQNFAGQRAAFVLANRLVGEIPHIEVHIPPGAGDDWLDILNGQNR